MEKLLEDPAVLDRWGRVQLLNKGMEGLGVLAVSKT
jgi:hypothetical protein